MGCCRLSGGGTAPSSHACCQEWQGTTSIAQLQSPPLPLQIHGPSSITLNTSYFPMDWLCWEPPLPPHPTDAGTGPEGAASLPQLSSLHWDLLTRLCIKWGVSSSLVKLSARVQSENRRPNEINSFKTYTGLPGSCKYSFCIADAPATVLVFSHITEKYYKHLWCTWVAVSKCKAASRWPSL